MVRKAEDAQNAILERKKERKRKKVERIEKLRELRKYIFALG